MGLFGSTQKDRAREQQAHEMEMQKQQQEWNLEMWNLQNEYNTPAAQVQRLKDAGLNPNLVSSSGNISGTADAVQPYQQADSILQPSDAENFMDTMQPIFAMTDQMQKIEQNAAQTRFLNSQANKTGIDYDFDKATFGARVIGAGLSNEDTRQGIAESKQRIAESQARIDKLIVDKDIQEKVKQWYDTQSQADLDVKIEQVNLLRNQAIDSAKSAELKDSQIALNEASTGLVGEQTEYQKTQNALAKVEKDFCDIMGFPIDTPMEKVMFGLWKSGKFDDWYNAQITVHSLKDNELLDTRAAFQTGSYMNELDKRRQNEIEESKKNYIYTQSGQKMEVNPVTGLDGPIFKKGMTKKEYRSYLIDKLRSAKQRKDFYELNSTRNYYRNLYGEYPRF